MQVIVGGRRSGKTHKLVEWLKEDPDRVLICHSASEAERLTRDYGIHPRQIMSISAWSSRGLSGMSRPSTKIAVDNLDLVLPILLGVNVEMVALTGAIR